jgi:hypothetical protein
MVNVRASCDDGPAVKRLLGAGALTLALVACSEDSGREFARYYDPLGFFTTNLPAVNDIMVIPPQAAGEGPGLLTGVISSPPAPSPAPQAGLGAFDFSQTAPPDQTIYQARAVTTGGFDDLDQMGLFFLTGDPAIDLELDEAVRIDGHEGRLVVADVVQNDQTTASLAAAFTLGSGGTGFLVAAVFPPGQWDAEREDFFRVLESFRTDVQPGLDSFPVAGEAS